MRRPPPSSLLYAIAWPLPPHPSLPPCSPPGPCSLRHHDDAGLHEPSHPSAATRLPPATVSLPCRFPSPPDARPCPCPCL
ncbi:hypothetical protein BJ912DRAFT_1146186 [Pholiota molesta]|nr:hypothetical protein BJ912DRAFT_1146186 [Pholiota molesta]